MDLAQFGHQLDEQELATMVEGAGTADDLRRLHEVHVLLYIDYCI